MALGLLSFSRSLCTWVDKGDDELDSGACTGAYALAIYGFDSCMADGSGQCMHSAHVQLLRHEGKPVDYLFVLVACDVSDIFVNSNRFLIGSADFLCNLLLSFEPVPLRHVSSNIVGLRIWFTDRLIVWWSCDTMEIVVNCSWWRNGCMANSHTIAYSVKHILLLCILF